MEKVEVVMSDFNIIRTDVIDLRRASIEVALHRGRSV